jgi:ribulose kinase
VGEKEEKYSIGVDFGTLLARYKGKIAFEWVMPKLMQILDEEEENYIDRSRSDEQRKILFIALFCEKT